MDYAVQAAGVLYTLPFSNEIFHEINSGFIALLLLGLLRAECYGHWQNCVLYKYLADPGEVRGCTTNTFVTD